MSKADIFREEVAKRRQGIVDMQNANIDVIATIEQFSKLDESYKVEEKKFREELECIYKETRHYNGQWPVVYSFAQTQRIPYFNGDSDDDCNPYYRISLVIAGQDEGLAPIFSETTRSGGSQINRQRSYIAEGPRRSTALSALQAYPDRTFEGAGATSGSCSDPQYTTQATCVGAMEIWTPGYNNNTAVDLLLNALNPWKSSLVQLKLDLCDADAATGQQLQDIIDEIDNCISLLPTPPTYPDLTPDTGMCSNPLYTDQATCELFGGVWTMPLQDSIDVIISYIQNEMVNIFDARKDDFNEKSAILEQKFFGVIGLRLHQINGSYTKLVAAKDQLKTHNSIIADHKKSIASLSVLIVGED